MASDGTAACGEPWPAAGQRAEDGATSALDLDEADAFHLEILVEAVAKLRRNAGEARRSSRWTSMVERNAHIANKRTAPA
jgi:hypothetical protein